METTDHTVYAITEVGRFDRDLVEIGLGLYATVNKRSGAIIQRFDSRKVGIATLWSWDNMLDEDIQAEINFELEANFEDPHDVINILTGEKCYTGNAPRSEVK